MSSGRERGRESLKSAVEKKRSEGSVPSLGRGIVEAAARPGDWQGALACAFGSEEDKELMKYLGSGGLDARASERTGIALLIAGNNNVALLINSL